MKFRTFFGAAAVLALTVGSAPAADKDAADMAVDAAKKYAGKTITIVWEAGLQSLDPLNFSGPKWEKLTGIKVKVVEVPTAEMFTKIMQEYRAGTGAYDALNVIPAWMPDLAQAGALEQLDPYVDKYGYRDELQDDRADLPRQPDDGQRQDLRLPGRRRRVHHVLPQGHLRAIRRCRTEFKAKYGYDLAPPKTWKQFDEIGQFLTDKMAAEDLRRRLLPHSRPIASSCSRSASATRAASSSTPTP